jgi:3-oxoacyl-[acyl-carrier protein] reductase
MTNLQQPLPLPASVARKTVYSDPTAGHARLSDCARPKPRRALQLTHVIPTLMNKLLGKRALVTAGAQGIGLAITQLLIRGGCDVFVHYHRSQPEAAVVLREAPSLGRRAAAASHDLTRVEACDSLVREATDFLGGLDILINNAGSLVSRQSLLDGTEDYWHQVMELNVGSMRRVSRAALPALIESGRRTGASIVNLASLAGRKGGAGGSLAYATAKGAVITFTRGLAAEVGPSGIRVNALAPGLILGTSFHQTHTKPEAAAGVIAGTPLGRAGNAADVARAAVFLASEFDGFITGATIDINGGVYAA